MLTWYYDSQRSRANDFLDVLKSFDDFGIKAQTANTREMIDDSGIKIEMPGVKHEDLDITIQGRVLKIHAKSRTGREHSYRYTVSSTVDESAIEAKLEDGLLEVTLPKKPESTPRKIKIS